MPRSRRALPTVKTRNAPNGSFLNQERNAERGLVDFGLEKEIRDVRQRIASINIQAKLRGERVYQGSTLHFISQGYQDIADALAIGALGGSSIRMARKP